MMGSGLLLSQKAQSMNPSHAFPPFTCGRVDYSTVEFDSRPATRLILWSPFQATSTATESWMLRTTSHGGRASAPQFEYDIWRGHFGNSAGAGSAPLDSAAVPEPNILTSSSIAIVLLALARLRWYNQGLPITGSA